MDSFNLEHSDSDSGESWSLVEHIPTYGDEVPDFPETAPVTDRDVAELNTDKDEDTDGISIISDSDPESPMPFDLSKCLNDPPKKTEYIPVNKVPVQQPHNHDALHEDTATEDDFLGDKNLKHKTYVHRRNKRLSTVLNIIVIGSVITAAGVAIGHMWGVKNDCAMSTTPSVNKILSNLYKLQEENAYLRSKLKELSLMAHIRPQQKKSGTEKLNKCRKVFEESLNKIADKPSKCVDNEDVSKLLNFRMGQPAHEKHFLQDIDKLKEVYTQNKSWLDDEVSKNGKKKGLLEIHSSSLNKDNKPHSNNLGHLFDTLSEVDYLDTSISKSNNKDSQNQPIKDRKISYADSLKPEYKSKLVQKRENKILFDENYKENTKINKRDLDKSDTISEEEFKKDDRYVGGRKIKKGKKKHDRQKLPKKTKSKNKYEQWEMKGGYLKDYDDVSETSSQENENAWKNSDKTFSINDFDKFAELTKTDKDDNKVNSKHGKEEKLVRKNGNNKEQDITWFEKRAVWRNEARKRVEPEIGESSPNNAGWYFRRMQRREQCRAKGDNSTHRKLLKRNMNFKMKH